MATSAARSPELAAYFAALNLLDARVLFSKVKISGLMEPGLQPQSPSGQAPPLPKRFFEESRHHRGAADQPDRQHGPA